jgi:ABC-2 type transport system permease protein
MLKILLAIITNTFTETLRQPVYGVTIAAAILLLIFSPSLAAFTLDDDNQLLKDMAISTILIAGLMLAVFAATTVITAEIENKTVLTVISKTVSRGLFVIGKFIGTAAAVIFAQYLLSLVLLMIVRHGVLQRAVDQHDPVVVTLGCSALAITCAIALAGNYFYQWRFGAAAITIAAILASVVIVIMLFIDPKWQYNPAQNHMHLELLAPILLVMLATVIITALATALAMRFNMVTTLTICVLIFVLGTSIQYWLGPIAAQPGIKSYFAWAAIALVPSINTFMVTNAIYKESAIPLTYIAHAAIYCLLYATAVILFAIAMFRHRQLS